MWLEQMQLFVALGLSQISKPSHHLPEKIHVLQGFCDMGPIYLSSWPSLIYSLST